MAKFIELTENIGENGQTKLLKRLVNIDDIRLINAAPMFGTIVIFQKDEHLLFEEDYKEVKKMVDKATKIWYNI